MRALDRLRDVGDDAVAPAADLVAEEAEAPGCSCADRTLGDDAPLATLAPSRRLLDHEPPFRHLHFEGRVVELRAVPVLQPRRDRLEDKAIQTNGVTARAERQPIPVDSACFYVVWRHE